MIGVRGWMPEDILLEPVNMIAVMVKNREYDRSYGWKPEDMVWEPEDMVTLVILVSP